VQTRPQTVSARLRAVVRGAVKKASETWDDIAISTIFLDLLLLAVMVLAGLHLLLHLSLSRLTRGTPLPAVHVTAGDAGLCLLWFAIAILGLSWLFGLYSRTHQRSSLNEQRLGLQVCLIATVLLCGGMYLFAGPRLPAAGIAVTSVAVAVVLGLRRALSRYRINRAYKLGTGSRRMLIVGENRNSESLRFHVEAKPELGHTFCGFLSIPGVAGDGSCSRNDVAGTIDQLAEIALKRFVDEVVVTEYISPSQVAKIIEIACECDLDVRILPGIHDPLTLHGPLHYLSTVPLIFLHRRRTESTTRRLKRAFDQLSAVVGLPRGWRFNAGRATFTARR